MEGDLNLLMENFSKVFVQFKQGRAGLVISQVCACIHDVLIALSRRHKEMSVRISMAMLQCEMLCPTLCLSSPASMSYTVMCLSPSLPAAFNTSFYVLFNVSFIKWSGSSTLS